MRKIIFRFSPKQYDHIFGKKKYHLSHNTRKIILFHREFFENTIFSEPLEKENMVFRAVLVSERNYGTTKFFTENLLTKEMKETPVLMNNLVYLGLLILDLSKALMYEF